MVSMAMVRVVIFESFIGGEHRWRQGGAVRTSGQPDQHRRRAGVSVSTVSKVLNGRPTGAGNPGADRPHPALHGYQVAPRSGIGVVDLLIGRLGGLWSEELIRGAVAAAAETEISVILSRVGSAGEFERWLKIATAPRHPRRAERAVLPEPGDATQAGRRHLPLVVIDPPTSRAAKSGRWAPPTGRRHVRGAASD